MAEVRVKIGADVKDLQKGVQTAERELQDLAKTAKAAAGSTDGLARSASTLVSGMGGAARASNGARTALTDLNRVVADAPFGFVAIQNNIDQLAGSFGSLIRESGGVKNALKSIAASFAGPAGILTLISLTGSAALLFGDRIVAAFGGASKAAKDAAVAVGDAVEGLLELENASGKKFSGSIDDLNALVDATRASVKDLERQFEGAAGAASNIRAGQFGGLSIVDPKQVAAQKEQQEIVRQRLENERSILASLEAQLNEVQGSITAQERLEALGAKEITQTEKQAEALKEVRNITEDIGKLRAAAFTAVGTPTPFVQRGSTPQVTTPLPGRPDKVFDETAVQEFLAAQERIRAQQEAVNAQLLQGNDIFTEFGVSGAAALADIALGFEKLADLGSIVSTIVKGLARDIAVAAAKAALLTVLFPGAAQAGGGFGKIFKGFLGIGGGAIGGAPSQSLINAPAAVAPLGRLAQASQSAQVVIPELTIRGNDLVVAFQRARAGSARTLGNIPLK